MSTAAKRNKIEGRHTSVISGAVRYLLDNAPVFAANAAMTGCNPYSAAKIMENR